MDETIIRKLGNYGSAYDKPGECRAYDYSHQPGNIATWRLGKVLSEASKINASDHLDAGLGLLKALQEHGFGVFELATRRATEDKP